MIKRFIKISKSSFRRACRGGKPPLSPIRAPRYTRNTQYTHRTRYARYAQAACTSFGVNTFTCGEASHGRPAPESPSPRTTASNSTAQHAPANSACLRLPGTDGKAKMSKSLGNCIYLSDEPEDIKKKIMSMYTDPNHLRVQDPGKVEGNPVFIYLDAFSRPEHFAEFLPEYQNLDELKAHYQRGGLGDVKVKKFLNSVMQAELEPIRSRRKEWEQRLPEVVEILKEGSAVAEKTAAATLAEVRKSMKIDYFTDDNLLK